MHFRPRRELERISMQRPRPKRIRSKLVVTTFASLAFLLPAGSASAAQPLGQITEFTSGLNPGSNPAAITAGPDGNLWFTDQSSMRAIGRVTPAGAITEFSAGFNPG